MRTAAGKLPEPVGLAVATHLALCPGARARYRRYEAFGGALLEGLAPAGMADDAWDRLLHRLDDEDDDAAPTPPVVAGHEAQLLPRPLRDYLPAPLEQLRWRSYGVAAEVELPIRAPGYRTIR